MRSAPSCRPIVTSWMPGTRATARQGFFETLASSSARPADPGTIVHLHQQDPIALRCRMTPFILTWWYLITTSGHRQCTRSMMSLLRSTTRLPWNEFAAEVQRADHP